MTKHNENVHSNAPEVIQRARYFLEAWELGGVGSTLSTVQDGPGTHVALTVQDLRVLLELAAVDGAPRQDPNASARPRQQEPMPSQTQALLQRAMAEIEYLHKSVMQAAGVTSCDGRDNSVAVALRAALEPAKTGRRVRAKAVSPAPPQKGAFVRNWTATIRAMPGGLEDGEPEPADGARSDKS